MKLWLLDADVIIDLLSFELFDTLVERHDIYASSIVIGEVKSFYQDGIRVYINFKETYIDSGKVKEVEPLAHEYDAVLQKIPKIWQQTIHPGEIESLAVLARDEELTICSCDSGAIKALPFLDASERGISVEKLIGTSGLRWVNLEVRHTEQYFQGCLKEGNIRLIQSL